MRITKGPVDVAGLAFDPATQTELDAHVADTTAVHGIADTSVLELTSNRAVASGYAGLDANVFVPAAQLARYRTAAAVAVGPSDASEVTLISQTIPGGLLGVTGAVRCTIIGDWLNNHASATRTVTLRVYAGGTKIYDAATAAITQSTTRRAFYGEMSFVNLNSASSNRLSGIAAVGTNAAPTTGISTWGTASLGTHVVPQVFASDIVAIDTALGWIFKVTLQLSASESTLDMRISQVLLEVL